MLIDRVARLKVAYVATGEVTTLKHEVWDDAVELVELGAGVTEALLAGAEGTEVLNSLGNDVVVEFEVDASSALWLIEVSLEDDSSIQSIGTH